MSAIENDSEIQSVWRHFEKHQDNASRDRLILTYSPLVKYVAGRMSVGLPSHVDEGDLVSYGLLGLINAIERFELEREIKFETYAVARIKGAIIDELRSMDWVPRSVRSRAREIERVIGELENKHKRAPSDEEICKALDMREEDFHQSLAAIHRSTITALDELWTISNAAGGADHIAMIDTLEDPFAHDPSHSFQNEEVRDEIAAAVRQLPERERLVVALYYYEELTLREIGEILGVTESRVSQLHTKAVLRLKSRLGIDLKNAA